MSHPPTAFKILPLSEYKTWQSTKSFHGSGIDLSDGYIHLSTAATSGETFSKYFSGQSDLVVVEVNLAKAAEAEGVEVKWEKSRGGEEFPHVYGKGGIGMGAVGRVWEGSEVKGELFEGLVKESQ